MMGKPTPKTNNTPWFAWRQNFILVLGMLVFVTLGWYLVNLQVTEQVRLQTRSEALHLRTVALPPSRGNIVDRNGKVLALSTPVGSLWANPAIFCADSTQWQPMLDLIAVDAAKLRHSCAKYANADFMYIQRHLSPPLSDKVMSLQVPGLGVQQEYKRYYPSGATSAHLVGFTNIDDVGLEGLERTHQRLLGGTPGRVRALKDGTGKYVEYVESIQQVRHGDELALSIDQRVQSLASEYLEYSVQTHRAAGGSVVVVGIPSGEILAMVNSPQFNPNDRGSFAPHTLRNRGATDSFEPGSLMKPFTVAVGIENAKISADTMVDTDPGYFRLGRHTIRDMNNYGKISVREAVARSSNVGMIKIAQRFSYDKLFGTFKALGFGAKMGVFSNETTGILVPRSSATDHATLSYGYGLSVSPLQLARAYTAFATDGKLLPLTLQPVKSSTQVAGERVFAPQTVRVIRQILEQASSAAGTGKKAQVPQYRIGGKTSTTYKFIDGAYQDDRYTAAFVGIAPLTQPRFVVAVVVDDPRAEAYYGGDVAAPVFANLVEDLMRIYNVKPDALPTPAVTASTFGDGR